MKPEELAGRGRIHPLAIAPTYDDARARIAADLAADERDYPGRSFMLIYRDDLKALLAGPPEPSVDGASVFSSHNACCYRDQCRAALASRPEPSVEEVVWQPIESAPTDGRSVLVFCPRASDHGYERIRLTWQKDGKWQGANNTSWPPTHWMPLPAPPTKGGE